MTRKTNEQDYKLIKKITDYMLNSCPDKDNIAVIETAKSIQKRFGGD